MKTIRPVLVRLAVPVLATAALAAPQAATRDPLRDLPTELQGLILRTLSGDGASGVLHSSAGGVRTEDAELFVPGGAPGGLFGVALDLQEGRAVVGAPGNPSHAGSVYVFLDDPVLGWRLEAKLDAGEAAHPGQHFGRAVAIDQDLIAVGAPGDDTFGNGAGRVFVHELGAEGWSLVDVVESDALSSGDGFGEAVALGTSSQNGSRLLLAGAPRESVQGSGTIGEGVAYAFTREGSAFVQRWTLRGSEPLFLGKFGRSIDFEGQHAAIGSDGNAYVFRHLHDDSWTEEWRLETAAAESGFYGQHVRIRGDEVFVGDIYGTNAHGVNCGAVHVFERTAPFTWTQTAFLSPPDGAPFDGSGSRFDVEGNLLVAQSGSDADGSTSSVYVWQKSGSTWSQVAKVGTPRDFLRSPELDGGRMLLAFSGYDGHFEDEGIVAVLSMNAPDSWNLDAELAGTNADPDELYGMSVAIEGDRAVVGAPGERDSAEDGGAAYVFEHDGTEWQAVAKLSAGASTIRLHAFGRAVALDRDRLAIGAPSFLAGSVPSVYVFERTAGVWSLVQRIDGPASSYFGWDLDLDGDRLLIGAWRYSAMSIGGAFVYDWDGAAWSQSDYLGVAGTTPDHNLGRAVALDGDVAVVGAFGYSGAAPYQGAAYVFDRAGATWSLRQRLESETPTQFHLFGYDVDLLGARLVVGAPGAGGDVHVFDELGGAFVRRATLDTPVTTGLGSSVVLRGERIAAAAVAEGATAESVFVFLEDGSGWMEEAELVASARGGLTFGSGLAMDTGSVLVGSSAVGVDLPGSALVYELGEPSPFIPYCFGDGSAGSACPCGNAGATGEGCASSIGSGARIAASGSPSVAANDLTVRLEAAPAGKPGLLFSGTTALAGVPFGDGLRCAGGATRRHGLRTTDGTGTSTWGPGLSSSFAPGPGESVYLQVWYRDPSGPCGSAFNLSPGLEVQLAP